MINICSTDAVLVHFFAASILVITRTKVTLSFSRVKNKNQAAHYGGSRHFWRFSKMDYDLKGLIFLKFFFLNVFRRVGSSDRRRVLKIFFAKF